MPDTFRDILCNGGDIWILDNFREAHIKFKEDGTGEFNCRIEFCIFIAAEFSWLAGAGIDEIVDVNTPVDPRKPRILGEIPIEMTLHTRPCSPFHSGQWANPEINTRQLKDMAFRPKHYIIRIEKGSFSTPYDAMHKVSHELTEWFHLRLVFDISPFPPLEEWRQPDRGPKVAKFWEAKAFAAQADPELKRLAIEAQRSWANMCILM